MTDISRKPRYVLHVFNKGSDSESSEDESRTNYGSALYSYNPPPLPALSRSPPPPPSPLTTNIPTRTPRTQASHQSLSSPSSASSPAAEEPTPSTDESSFADRSHRADIPPITTARGVTGKLFHGLKSPFHHKPPHPRPQPPTPSSSSLPTTSPIVSTPDSYTSASSVGSSSTVSERVLILATADSDRYVNVDITEAKSAEHIRECVFAKLNILDDEQSHFSIYRTEIGFFALGEALSDEKLVELCRVDGDSKGSLKLLVSHSSASVHEPIRPSVSPSVNTVPPPVLPNYNTPASYAPLRPRRRSRSRHGSLSSASEQLTTEVSAGYEADLDNNAEREPLHRPTPVRPLPPINPPLSNVPPSPDRRPIRPSSPRPSRSNTPSPPVVTERTRAPDSTTIVQDRFGNFVPAPPPPPPLSPHRATFSEDQTLIPPRRHVRSGSDAAAEREQLLEASEQQLQTAGQRWRNTGRLNQQSSRDTLRDRRPRTGVLQDEPLERSDSWVFISRQNDASPQAGYDPESSPPTQTRHSPIKSRISRNQQPLSPARYNKPAYSGRPLNIPAAPRHPPPNVPLMSPESRPGPSRAAGQPVPANFIVTWKGEEKGDQQKLTPTSGSAPWSRSLKGAKSMDSLRAGSIPPMLQPGRRGNGPLPLSGASNNLAFTAKSYDSRTRNRLLPGKASPQQPSQYAGRSSSSGFTGGYMSPNGQEPYPRPHSALSDVMTSPTNKYQRPYQGSMYPSTGTDYMDSGRSPPSLSPSMPLVPSRQNSHPSSNGVLTSSPPHSPSSPQSPRLAAQSRHEFQLRKHCSSSASKNRYLGQATTLRFHIFFHATPFCLHRLRRF
ncbi:hypothetical protein BDZ89DRAFT_193985 [Hymenopellis radicata]|nr:hypothetical protein BDZ89DRAFT_193985 [Hymenopellis radicata]